MNGDDDDMNDDDDDDDYDDDDEDDGDDSDDDDDINSCEAIDSFVNVSNPLLPTYALPELKVPDRRTDGQTDRRTDGHTLL